MKKYLLILILSIASLAGLKAQLLVYGDHNIPVSGRVGAICFSPGNRFVACGLDNGAIHVWDLDAKRQLHKLNHGGSIKSLLIDTKSRYLVSAGTDKNIIIWDLYSGEIEKIISDYKGKISNLNFNPDETLLSVCGSRKEVFLFQFPGGKLIAELKNGHNKEVIYSTFNSDGTQLLTVGKDNQAILWNTSTRQILRKTGISPNTINGSGIEITRVQAQPDRRKFLVAYTETKLAKGGKSMIFRYNTALFNWDTGLLENIYEDNVKPIDALDITPDGSYYITDNSTLRLKKLNFRDINTGDLVKSQQTEGDIESMKVSDNGEWLAVAEDNGSKKQPEVKLYKLSGLATTTGTGKNTNNLGTRPSFNSTNTRQEPAAEELRTDMIGKYYALLIGINEYDDPMITDLDAPITDAENLYIILSTSYSFRKDNIIFLENPKRHEIIDALDLLERTVTENDNLLIFYAGHGHWDESAHKGYWLPSDAHHESTANWFRNSSLTGYIASIKSKHTLLIADACFSGSIFKTRAAFPKDQEAVARLYEKPSRKAMTSGTLKEVPDQSVFVRFLMKNLANNKEEFMPSEQLFYTLKPAVLNNSDNIPQFGEVKNAGDEGGDFIFIRKK